MESSPSRGDLKIDPVPITIRIGVTGHHALLDSDKVRGNLMACLEHLAALLSHTPFRLVILTPLAEGADRLVAQTALDWKCDRMNGPVQIEAILPLPVSNYLKDFKKSESKAEFKRLLKNASASYVLQGSAGRPEAYRRIGYHVATHCDLLIAIYDGKEARGKGGTAEIYQRAKYNGRTIWRIDPITGISRLEPGEDRTLPGLERLDRYNAEKINSKTFQQAAQKQLDYLNKAAVNSGLSIPGIRLLFDRMLAHYAKADELALRYQAKFLRSGVRVYWLSVLAVLSVSLQVLFWPKRFELIGLEAVAMFAILALINQSNKHQLHLRWIDYRFLAERIRSAFFLRLAGVPCTLSPPLPHLSDLRWPSDWLAKAFDWIYQSPGKNKHLKRLDWPEIKSFTKYGLIDDQVSYFEKSWRRKETKNRNYENLGFGVFGLTFLIAFLHLFGGHGDFALMNKIFYLLAIVLPALGAAMTGIRSHMEYSRTAEQYRNMARHMSMLSDRLEDIRSESGLKRFLLTAHEMLLRENQEWRAVYLLHKLDVP
jgi:hypothetical protein